MNNIGRNGGTVGADIGMEDVWNTLTGAPQMIVAILDSGIDHGHEDLARNIWINTREIPGNHLDDDGDGLVDDYYGYNFYGENGDTTDEYFHGTHIGGTIGAVGNNAIGVTGVNWNVKLMGLKILSSTGAGSTSDIIRAIDYAVDHGAKVINASWGFSSSLTSLPADPALEPSQALRDAIAAADQAGVIFVAAAGNYALNNDAKPFYPASYSLKNILSVAATESHDLLASFSNYGAVSVDLGAPGQTILSTYPSQLGRLYAYASGTSMAAPHVAGAAALLWTENPSLTHRQVIEEILQGVQPQSSLQGKTATGGRLDVARSLALNLPQPNYPPVGNAGPGQTKLVGQTVTLSGTAFDQDGDTPLAFAWTLKLPTGSKAVLNQTTSPQVSFLADIAGTYLATLVVSDGQSFSVPAIVTIQVSAATTTAPPSTSLRIKRNAVSVSSTQIAVGDSIALDASASRSYNGQALTYRWYFVEKPAGSLALLNNASGPIASFKPDLVGRYTVHLTLSDGKLSSNGEVAFWASAATAPQAPTISFRVKRNGVGITSTQVNPGDLITLDASASNPNGPYSLTFGWSFASKPVGSLAKMSAPSSSISTFKPDIVGKYVVNLAVSNGYSTSTGQLALSAVSLNSASLSVTAMEMDAVPEAEAEENSPDEVEDPEAEPLPEVHLPLNVVIEAREKDGLVALDLLRADSVPVDEVLSLSGTGSTSPSDSAMNFQWSLVRKPETSVATIENAQEVDAQFAPDSPGWYVVRLSVDDGETDSNAELSFLAQP